MTSRRGSRWWWTMALLPAMAVSACGGSRLTHDAIAAAVRPRRLQEFCKFRRGDSA